MIKEKPGVSELQSHSTQRGRTRLFCFLEHSSQKANSTRGGSKLPDSNQSFHIMSLEHGVETGSGKPGELAGCFAASITHGHQAA